MTLTWCAKGYVSLHWWWAATASTRWVVFMSPQTAFSSKSVFWSWTPTSAANPAPTSSSVSEAGLHEIHVKWNVWMWMSVKVYPLTIIVIKTFRFVFFPLIREGRVAAFFAGLTWAKSSRVHPGWVASSSQDPYWWEWLPHKVPTAHQEQLWGSVSCSRILRHVVQSCPG